MKQFLSIGPIPFGARSEMMEQDDNSVEELILAVDTSSGITSAAVARGKTLLRAMNAPADETRSEKLWIEIGSLLESAKDGVREVDVFAVCTGPGSFTGLRVGIAAMKGFASAARKPIVGVTSLEAAAFSAQGASVVCAMVNAYKGEVYSQLFSLDQDGVPVAGNAPMVSSFEEALDRVGDRDELTFAGNAAEAGRGLIEARPGREWSVRRSDQGTAEAVAALAYLRIRRGEAEEPASIKACYVRPAEAEIKLSLGLLGSKIKRSMKSE